MEFSKALKSKQSTITFLENHLDDSTQTNILSKCIGKIARVINEFSDVKLWSIPSESALQVLEFIIAESKSDTVVELGAGYGIWTELLRKRNPKIKFIATDSFQSHNTKESDDVEKLTYQEAIEKYNSKSTLFFWSWCPYQLNINDSLVDVDNYVHIGEPPGGSCGNESLFEQQDFIYHHYVPRFFGSTDNFNRHRHYQCMIWLSKTIKDKPIFPGQLRYDGQELPEIDFSDMSDDCCLM